MITPAPLINRLLPQVTFKMPNNQGLYLTFDDGPSPSSTPAILEILDRYNAKATFFFLPREKCRKTP